MGRSSLRTVTNINIDGQAVNAYARDPAIKLSFKVNCDSLSWVRIKYYDNTDGTSQSYYYPKGGGMIAKHNGETFVGKFGGTPEEPHEWFKLGHDYTGVMTIYQNYPKSGDADNAGPGKYDVVLGSGRIQESATASTEVYIDKDIISIKDAVYFEDSSTGYTRLVGGCMLQIDGVQTMIEHYSPNTGKAELTSALTVTAGTLYYLVSNYIECDPFYWYCRSDPEVTLTAEYDDAEGIIVSGVYSQAEDVAMQSYQFSCDGEKGDKKFTYTFEDKFPFPGSYFIDRHNITCKTYTQENHYKNSVAFLSVPPMDTTTLRLELSETAGGIVKLRVLNAPAGARMYIWKVRSSRSILVGTRICTGDSDGDYFFDKASEYKTHLWYVVNIIATVNSSRKRFYTYGDITTTARKVELAALTELNREYHRRIFRKGTGGTGVYEFDINGNQGEIRNTLGSAVYETEAESPNAVYTDKNYESGNLSFCLEKLGTVIDPVTSSSTFEDSYIYLFNDFIASKKPFLMRDNAGNSRIVALTSASRKYDYNANMNKITLGWTEICKIWDAMIK